MIYSSIDTLHVIYYNYTMEQIFKHLNLPVDNFKQMYVIDEYGECKNISYRGYKFEMKFNYNNIWFHGDCLTVDIDAIKPDNFFTFVFKSIRVEFTGQGIEYLRRTKFNPDDKFISRTWWDSCCTPYKITRVDFAYDYVNEKKELFDGIFDYVDNFQLQNRGVSRLYTSRGGGISFQRKYGGEDTLYLGTRGSDKLLRIYDKKLERGDKIKSLDLPAFMTVENVDTWYRVELQFRRFYCAEQLFGNHGDLKNNLLFLFDNFMLFEKDEQGIYRAIKPMVDLYDWTKLQQLYKKPITEEVNEVKTNIDTACDHHIKPYG